MRLSNLAVKLTYGDYERINKGIASSGSDTPISMDDFLAIVKLTPADFYASLEENASQCIEHVIELAAFLKDKCQPDEFDSPTNPKFEEFRNRLEKIHKKVVELKPKEEVIEAENIPDDPAESGDTSKPQPSNQAMTRESAFRTIEQIAKFFEKTEPHSPVHYSLRQVIRWGKMPLNELLAELIDDDKKMSDLKRLIGLPSPPEEDQS